MSNASQVRALLPSIAGFVAYVTAFVWPDIFRDPDSLWHVTTGQWMLRNGGIPTRDIFSFSAPEQPWVAHEWLSELLMAWLHSIGGWALLHCAAAVLFAVTMIILARHAAQYMAPHAAVSFLAVCWLLMLSHLLVRPHLWVWPIIALWSVQLAQAVDRRHAPPWWLAVVMILWANLHGSFVLGIALLGGFLLEALWCAWTSNDRRHVITTWLPQAALITTAALINPRGINALWHALELMQLTTMHQIIAEWRSTDFQRPQGLSVWLALVISLALSGRLRTNLVRAVMVLGALYLALKHTRHHSLLGLLSPALLASGLVTETRPGEGSTAEPSTHANGNAPATMRIPRSMVGIFLLGGLVALGTFLTKQRWAVDPTVTGVPARALAAADSAGVQGRVLNLYGFGGYLIFRGIPVFIDGRTDMYGDTFLARYHAAVSLVSREALETLLQDFDIGWTLLTPSTPAVLLLDDLPGWTRVYSDSLAVVHRRLAK